MKYNNWYEPKLQNFQLLQNLETQQIFALILIYCSIQTQNSQRIKNCISYLTQILTQYVVEILSRSRPVKMFYKSSTNYPSIRNSWKKWRVLKGLLWSIENLQLVIGGALEGVNHAKTIKIVNLFDRFYHEIHPADLSLRANIVSYIYSFI